MVSFILDQAEAKGVCQIICILSGVGRARVTCTGHVHCKSLHRAPGALGQSNHQGHQDKIKIINQSTHFINELLYMHFVTAAALAAFSASARTLCDTLSRPPLADIKPPFETTCWSPYCRFARAYTATYVLYRSSLANARSVALILAPFISLYNGPRCLASCLYT